MSALPARALALPDRASPPCTFRRAGLPCATRTMSAPRARTHAMPRCTLPLLCAALALTPAVRAQREDPDRALAHVLEVQNALASGRQLLAKGDAKKAVDVLEA